MQMLLYLKKTDYTSFRFENTMYMNTAYLKL